jgi:hypothetical protein
MEGGTRITITRYLFRALEKIKLFLVGILKK